MPFMLDEFLPYRLNVAATLISRRFAALHQEETGISIPEWRVMAHLANEGQVSIRDIHARVNLDKSIVSRAAARLEQAGHLRKSGHMQDRRLISLELTPKGQDLMQRLGEIADAFQARLHAELGPDAERFETMLEQLIAGAARDRDTAA
ncbi:MarR family winged helix-turn-helix transcriptional regulator [Paracoccus onubensis]|uniref:MarR family winged helix-turn-helix transcriptional regulator n=1 Tax=Paracoccus onubensis TaxID=1675788 RepID=UPI00272F50DE|nr:MarR family winged helix-turn-helix transcriptional regulator [Paracoccus onubensis]MDP0925887.1 MarR family winged helix-turn-helix transcriptional regulator [Paracoccus onubensis]